MSANWIYSSTRLPREGQQIEFVLDHRNVAIEGAYVRQSFRTRWAEYTIERVRRWRQLTLACDLAVPVQQPVARIVPDAPRYVTSPIPSRSGGITHAA